MLLFPLSPPGRSLGPGPFQAYARSVARGIQGVQANPSSTVVVGSISATQIASALADRPCVLAAHPIRTAWRTASSGFRSQWSATGAFGGSDATDPTAPTYNAYDRLYDTFTRPSSASTQWYLLFDLGTLPATFDAALILGHNFGQLGGLTVKLEVADTPDFATNLRTLATWNPGAHTARLVSLSLNGAQAQLSTVEFIRLNISGPTPFQPQVGEVMVSARDQLNSAGLLAYDPDQQTGRATDFASRSGVIIRYDYNDGQAAPSGKILASGAADWAPITSWWTNCSRGMEAFGWIEKPNSAPNTCLWMMHAKPDRAMPYESDQVRRYSFSLLEQGSPFFSQET